MKSPAFYTAALAIGDCICATPFLRKLSSVYNSKVRVFSHFPEVFQGLPYVLSSEDFKDHVNNINSLSESYDMYKSFWHLGKKVALSDPRGIEFKHAQMDIRQYHAIDNGMMLTPEEMQCDFYADFHERRNDLPSKYVVLHPFKNWESRTWGAENWKALVHELTASGIECVILGKDSLDLRLLKHLREETTTATQEEVFEEMQRRQSVKIEGKVIDLSNQTNLAQAWHVINGAVCVVTMDSGILHLAGTTDTHILQLGSSINPFFRAPYRKGSQSYKYHYVKGSCDLFCASNPKYSLREWSEGYNGATPLQSVPPIDKCLERKAHYECHPGVTPVIEKVKELWEAAPVVNTVRRTVSTERKVEASVSHEEERTLIRIHSEPLGDNIGALAMVDLFSLRTGKKVDVITKFGQDIFGKSYPNLNLLPKHDTPILDVVTGKWKYENKSYSEYKEIFYLFDRPLMKGFSDQLGIEYEEHRPKMDLHLGERPIRSKYVCFSMHSTAQCKHWNYPGGWETLCRMLRKAGITPVCIDRYASFGVEGSWNPVPGPCVKKHGLDLKEMTNYIHHSEFFIGISSGLSWVAHALGKPVVMISGVTGVDNEFQTDTLKIVEKSVCHGCINMPDKYKFDPGDWNWCPVHKGTSKQFECTTSITPERVFEEIKNRFAL